ncbi:DUF6873 family GME fold protein [Ihubacter sp. rT4E-8]|uniref:DUF6873 family GME fold protein n=1 Tax=Ihubacter sp. rT4E-8 TaxID=3242369 RepID=UPI003CFA1D5B
MNKIYIAKDANIRLKEYLNDTGYCLEFVASEGIVDKAISNHPDVFLCKMGIEQNAPIFFAAKEDLGKDYPAEAAFNAACTGKYFIHNLNITNEKLLFAAKEMGMILVDVRQGYTKCSVVIVDETSLITYDEGIIKACSKFPDISVLRVAPGFVRLDGYDTGFIGGASGRVGKEIIFHGDLFGHPDFSAIVDFIEKRGLTCKWFPQFKLTDIGSIL